MIVEKIAPEDPSAAFDLLWQFVDLAPSIYERVDDSRGDVGDVFRAAILHFEELGPRAAPAPEQLADRVWHVVLDNGYGEWDHIITLLAPTLGDAGLSHLKDHIIHYAGTPIEEPDSAHDAILFLRELRGQSDYRAERRQQFVKSCLQEIAAAMGDTAAYIAQYGDDDLRRKRVAAEVALLLLEEGSGADALATLANAEDDGRSFGQEEWDDAYIATLLALGREEEAQAHRWACFETRLSAPHLRAFLKVLPDFEDIEAEDRAKAFVLAHPNVLHALHFCLQWPDLLTAARMVEDRAAEIDGDHYELLGPAAEALRDRHPLAATLLWRAMIDFALYHGRSSRYGHAANHLRDCAAAADEIADFGGSPTHEVYLAALQSTHERKSSFWAKVG